MNPNNQTRGYATKTGDFMEMEINRSPTVRHPQQLRVNMTATRFHNDNREIRMRQRRRRRLQNSFIFYKERARTPVGSGGDNSEEETHLPRPQQRPIIMNNEQNDFSESLLDELWKEIMDWRILNGLFEINLQSNDNNDTPEAMNDDCNTESAGSNV